MWVTWIGTGLVALSFAAAAIARSTMRGRLVHHHARLSRVYGSAAVLGGLLRALTALLPDGLPTLAVEVLYAVIDCWLLIGLVGLHLHQRERAGRWGSMGFGVATLGMAVLIGPDGTIAGMSEYAVGAGLFAVGLSIFAAGTLRAAALPRWIPALWVASAALGFAGFLVPGAGALFVLSGLLLGASYAGGGLRLLG